MRNAFFISGLALLAQSSFGLTVEEVSAKLGEAPKVEYMDMVYTTSVKAGAIAMTTKTHQITDGAERFWMEVESQMGTQRTIRNGAKIQIIDVQSGQKRFHTTPSISTLPDDPKRYVSMVQPGKFKSPVPLGNNIFALERIPGTDPALKHQRILFDADRSFVTEILEVTSEDDSTRTKLTPCATCERQVPTRIEIAVNSKGQKTELVMQYSKIVFPKSLPSAIFDFE